MITELVMGDTTIKMPGPARATLDALEHHIRAASDALLADQQPDGHWVFELEADATIPAEYVLMVHYFAETRTSNLSARSRLSASHSRRARRLAAVPRGRVRHERKREGLLRAEMTATTSMRSQAPRARGDSVARRCGQVERLHRACSRSTA